MHMTQRAMLTAALIGIFPSAALAADDFITGVYLKSAQLCEQAKKSTLKPLIDAGQMVLSSRGFDTTGSDCAFMQVLKHPRKDKAWLVTGFCEEPGYASPDVFTIIERAPGKLDVASIAEGDSGGMETEEGGGDDGSAGTDGSGTPTDGSQFANSGIGGSYFLCDGVTLP